MNHDPKNKRPTQRRLNVEMMETRLMLSISPDGMAGVRDFTDVEIVPSPMQDSHSVDLLDFNDMASQFNDLRLSKQISQIVPMPELPKNEDGPLDLQNPVTFISTAEHTGATVYAYSFSAQLSDESTSIDWNAMTAEDQDSDRMTFRSAVATSSSTAGKSTDELRDSETKPSSARPEPNTPLDRVEEKMDRTSVEGDSTRLNDDPGNSNVILRSDFESLIEASFSFARSDAGELPPEESFAIRGLDLHQGLWANDQLETGEFLVVLIDHDLSLTLNEIPFGISTDTEDSVYAQHFDTSSITLSDYNPLSNYDLGDDISLDDLPADWANESEPIVGLRSTLPGQPSNPWDVPPPPSTSGNNIQDTLQATASMFYKELFDGYRTNYTNDAGRLMSSTAYDDFPQTSSFMQQYMNDEEEEVFEENFLFTQLGGSTFSEADTEELALSGDKEGFDLENLEIEGLIETELNEMLVDNDGSNNGEDGVVDISIAMNLSQKPVEATPEGIVEAGLQQDEKVAFEGLYGQGQTFELANAEEEEAFLTEDSSVGEVSPKVLDTLNQTPLNASNQKNLDNTDLNPSAHEMALGQVTGELDYASMIPSDALSWAAFAFVGQHTTRHPDDRKKKK